MVFLACDLDLVITAVAEIAKEFRAGLFLDYQWKRLMLFLISLCDQPTTSNHGRFRQKPSYLF